MRTTLFSLLVAIVLWQATLFGQYPTNEKIQPYPVPVKERTLHQRFVCDSAGATQWRALHQSTLTPLGESLRIESSGHDPYVLLSPIATPKAGTFEFRIRMKNEMKSAAEIFWAVTERPDFLAKNAKRFDFLPDGEWYTYAVEFTTTEPLTFLRFDPGVSVGVAEIAWVELYHITHGEVPENPTPWVDLNWKDKVEGWWMIGSGNILIKFDLKGTGAVVFIDDEAVGEIYPLTYRNPILPLGGVKRVPFADTLTDAPSVGELFDWKGVHQLTDTAMMFRNPSLSFVTSWEQERSSLQFFLKDNELFFELRTTETSDIFGPVFRPYGEMQQAVLCGVEYLEEGEHSSSTADIETKEHLRFAPSPMDITWQFMSVVTDKVGFGLLWDDPHVQPIFATPDFILGDAEKHHMGLYGGRISGTLKIVAREPGTVSPKYGDTVPGSQQYVLDSQLDKLILWAFQKRGGAPDLPKRLRNDEDQRLLNLAGFEKSRLRDPNGNGWHHAILPDADKQQFDASHGSDYITAIWQLSGKLITDKPLAHGGAHLPNPASFFLRGEAENFRTWKKNESRQIRSQQRPDGSFPYSGTYLRGHWEDTASGHCGNALYRLLYTYRILGEPEALASALKGLEFANKYTVPRGAQVWELSLHTPDIMASSRMCMANVWAFEATGDPKYLAHARRWAITGLPFVYLWERKPLAGKDDPIMLYATTPVFGATTWIAPNWIGLPVQWCGLDYAEACFMLAKHDKTVDWWKIAEGILVTAERKQYTEGPSIGLLPDSYTLSTQTPNPFDINPSVLVQQRRRLQGKIAALDIALSADKKFRVVSPYKTAIEDNTVEGSTAVIEGVAGTSYQIIVNGTEVKTIESKGTDRIVLGE